MANITAGNPIIVDTAATIWTDTRNVVLMQWVDDANDIADGDDLQLGFNGTDITIKLQITDNTANNAVFWQAGPFSSGIPVNNFVVTTIDHGELHIWLQ